ncbi:MULTISPECIES: TraR/DksA family transcriptional regulator [Pseudomonas]|jgi:DnaK suppressor protein|uniref:TraR/DksA family transcriptional regulator n=2 Tax=Pseudomonas TaxID=286 RepID=A0A7X1KZR5_9PSED|nr:MULTISPECIES: TraR/DksA family transcriptional regulator [Pseudomonas]MBC2692695.1 TraR/DksA family transcriptional regulator [Pseudomonas kielensis]MDD1009381.1 RNA polymerase-binding protein DksA [Pseudomonas shahriarae]
MTPQQLIDQPDDQYMGPEQTSFFRDLLLSQRRDAIARIETLRGDMAGLEKAADEVDVALNEQERQGLLSGIDRENQNLRDIKLALDAIDSDEYGWCAETGEKIGLPRLLSNPRSLLTVEAKQRRETQARHQRAA